MPIPEFVEKWGHLVAGNPVPFLALALIVAAMTWWFAHAHFSGQIAVLRAHKSFLESKLDGLSQPSPQAGTFSLTQEQYGKIVEYLSKFTLAAAEQRQRIVTVA